MRVVAIVCVLLTGCSIAIMERAPELATVKPGQQVHCTASRGWAAVDVAYAVGHLSGIVIVRETLSEADVGLTGEAADDANRWALVFVGAAVLHTASAIYGLREAGRCEDARRIAGPQAIPPEVKRERPPGF